MEFFADVILPLALPRNYTYRVPTEMASEIKQGMRVVVQLGKRKLYTALVKRIHHTPPEGYHPKDILEIEDKFPIVDENQMKLWEWMHRYYMCSEGEIMTAALPSGFKLESETIVLRNQRQEIVDEEINDHQYLILEALERQESLSIKEISIITSLKNPLKVIHELLGMGYILLEEELKNSYRPKQKRYVKLADGLKENSLNEVFEQLEKAPKQRDLLMHFFRLSRKTLNDGAVVASRLLKESDAGEGSLKALEKKGVLQIFVDKEINDEKDSGSSEFKDFSPEQTQAFELLEKEFNQHRTVLLHGVTSSGKTELYVRLIQQCLEKSQQVLYLVPEIALTTQLISRLRQYFGDKVLVYHSRFSDRERVETWLQLTENKTEGRLIIGARSSIFLPFGKLGLVIVDEEHESSYKQYDPAPRYHARDTAIILACIHAAKVLLGSATPSIESYYNAGNGKYGLVEMHKRYGDLPMPEILCVDLKHKHKKKLMSSHFSDDLLNAMKKALADNKQVILFQNRRGFTTMIQCQECGHVAQCKNCDISLTYHKHIDLLKCHYCGYSRQVPRHCPACGSPEIRSFGFGTEKLEDDLKLLLEKTEVQRLDLDSTRKKHAYENIITNFEDGSIDILVGTQMVTKGLDFENVALVGIMNADSMLNFPDFRSHERAFQLMAQVAGRAGRKGNRGTVLIQTSDPYHQVVRKVMENDYTGMYKDEIYERRNFKYPPFYRLIKIIIKHRDQSRLSTSATALGRELSIHFGSRILGPEFSLIPRLRNKYQMEIMLKLEENVSLKKVKIRLREVVDSFFMENPKLKVQIIFDVDPM